MRKAIIAVFLFLAVVSLIACSAQKQASSGTPSASSGNAAASNNINGALDDVGTSDQDLNVNDTGSATDSGLDDVQAI